MATVINDSTRQSELQAADHGALNAFEMDLHRWLNSARTAINMGEELPPMPVFERPEPAE